MPKCVNSALHSLHINLLMIYEQDPLTAKDYHPYKNEGYICKAMRLKIEVLSKH